MPGIKDHTNGMLPEKACRVMVALPIYEQMEQAGGLAGGLCLKKKIELTYLVSFKECMCCSRGNIIFGGNNSSDG